METVSFGRTGLKVSKLCFGTMGVGSSEWKPWVLDEADAKPLLKRCLDLGITFFDMADWYSIGEGERVVGSTLTSMAPRDRLVFATKAKYPMSDDPNDQGLSRKHLLSSIDSSLHRMGTDYVDIFMVHAFDPHTRAPVSPSLPGSGKPAARVCGTLHVAAAAALSAGPPTVGGAERLLRMALRAGLHRDRAGVSSAVSPRGGGPRPDLSGKP